VSYYQTYSIEGDEITLGNDRIKISIETKYILPDGAILNVSSDDSVKKNIVVEDARTVGAVNSPETEAARKRIEELRKQILDLTTKLYDIRGRASKENTLSSDDWQKIKKIQETLDKARAFVLKEMENVHGVAPVRHDNALKATREQLHEQALSIAALQQHHYAEIKKKAAS
jgi:polyhydroxyalkanoate synthesis regulator phasin